MKLIASLIAAGAFAILAPQTASARKSALDHIQFDGVSSDGELKTEHQTRRQWLETFPVQAKTYWDAWDCKNEICDSSWKANIRKKAALIKRTDEDAPARVQQPTKK
jgi:hypothetical protein